MTHGSGNRVDADVIADVSVSLRTLFGLFGCSHADCFVARKIP
ncbi:hypothetical protein CAter10_3113 [Collimonas arenae]|nr:hypothetical protein CAter10_3113 [Collimonas arenae]